MPLDELAEYVESARERHLDELLLPEPAYNKTCTARIMVRTPKAKARLTTSDRNDCPSS